MMNLQMFGPTRLRGHASMLGGEGGGGVWTFL